MGWKLLADYLAAALAAADEYTPARSIRGAMAAGLIADGDVWMAAGKLRNTVAHTYSRTSRDAGLDRIITDFLPMLDSLDHDMRARAG